ncbi:hypothetical protein HC341_13750 [Aquisalimonas sp. 2447]|uniref:hypothetical protein n=1 Tax=Aquisalimonas sp. 2447 TaxID=2740807 RepID=UPI0014327417|nr:hypothetical protein [Aquisalimonas sp. 2447]QIT56165.1 hypothetical protein HC341_13750 [Aquisalimonas sp. 2447]
MKLEALRIQRLPGLNDAIAVEAFGDDITVVTGPNASGKSSLVRSLRLLLAPGRGDPPDVLLQATFADGDERWQVERFGRDTVWRRNGAPADAPVLPDAEALGGYFLAIDELLGLTRVDEAFTRRLQQELAGGYDLRVLHREGGPAATHPNRDRDAGQRLLEAEQALRQAEAGNSELLQRRQRLPSLDEDIARSAEARRRLYDFETASLLVKEKAKTREASLALARFPETMPEGISRDDVEALERSLRDYNQAAEQAREHAEAQETELRDTGFEDSCPTAEDIATLRRKVDDLGDLVSRLLQAEEQLAAEQKRASAATEVLDAIPEVLPQLTTAELKRLDEHVQALAAAQADAHEAGAAARQAEQETDHAGRTELRSHWSTVAATAAGAAGGAVLAVRAWESPYWLTAAALLVVAAGLGWLTWRAVAVRGAAGKDARDAMRTAWKQRAREAEQRLEQTREQLRTAAKTAGIAPTPDQLAQHFQLFLQRVATLDAARRAVAETEGRVNYLSGQAEELGRTIHAGLAQWQATPEHTDHPGLRHALDALDRRRQHAESLRQEIRRFRDQEQQASSRAREADQRLQALYQQADLEPGDRDTLLARIRDLPEWQAASNALRDAEAREHAARESLQKTDDPELLARAEAEDAAWIEEQRDHARAEADNHQALIEEKTGIEHAIRDAERALRLEEARARRDQAEDALTQRYEQRMVAEASQFLLGEVEQAHRREHQPEAIRVADQRLRQFTHNAFSLVMADDGSPCAQDSQSREVRPLEALSVGTRMQLLVALRMAWVERRERHHAALPLILDEALSTTDPHRFEAVATALHSITRSEGRQLIYLSAQPEDLERWKRATGAEPMVVSLGHARGAPAAMDALPLPEAEQVPAPDGHTAASYAQALGVAAMEPTVDAGHIHLAYLLPDDLALLYHLLSDLRLGNVGQAETFLEGAAAQRHLDSDSRRRLDTRITAARAWMEAARIGRGTPLDRPALEQGAVGNWKQLDALVERATRVDGDPEAFLESLRMERISGIGEGKIQQIAQWLEDAGFLDPRPRLDASGRYHHVLARLPDHADSLREARTVVDALERATGVDDDQSGATVIAGW